MSNKTISDYKDAVLELGASVEELGALRIRTAGMEVVDHSALAKLETIRQSLAPLARMHNMFGEERACAVFDWKILNGLLPECVPADVERVKKELRFKTGRKVDRAVFHTSGRLSTVEIKDACDQRAVVAGIGQALLYASLAEKEYPSHHIVPVLAVLGLPDPDVARACKRGGVEYVALGDVQFMTLMSKVAHFIAYDGRP